MGDRARVSWMVGGLLLALSGCENIGTAAQSKTVQGGVLGSALGAGTGAIIGHQTGRAGEGAAIGAGLGAVGGALAGHALSEQDRQLSRQPAPAGVGSKFCPVGGEVYGPEVRYCPIHGVELRTRE